MAFEYRWDDVGEPVWPSMTLTTLLNDNSVGDTSTGETATASYSLNTRPTLTLITVVVYFTAFVYFGTSQDLTGMTAKVVAVRDTTAVGSECTVSENSPVAPPDGGTWSFTTWGGSQWTEQDSGPLSVISMGEGSQSTSISSTFATARSCWGRLSLVYTLNYVTCEGGLAGSLTCTDIRFTAADTGLTCVEGDGGGDGPGDGSDSPYPDPTQTAEDCPCPDFAITVPTTPTFATSSRRTNTYAVASCRSVSFSNNPCAGQEITYLRWSTGEYLVKSNGTYYTSG